MKNIIHFQIPIREGKTTIQDAYSISSQVLGKFMQLAENRLGLDYKVIASPCLPSLLSKDSVVYNFDMKQLSVEELTKILEETKP